MIPVEVLLDHGAGLIGSVGIADVQRDILLADRENGALMEHLGTGVAQFPQFVVSNLGDGLGILHNPGIRHQNAGNVGPVFIDGGIQCCGGQGAGDITAAPGEGLDVAVGHQAVEAGDHGTVAPVEVLQRRIGLFLVHGAVEIEPDPVSRIDEVEAQEACHQLGGEILAPADQFILGYGLGIDALFQRFEFCIQIQINVQLLPDLQIPGSDHLKNTGAVHAVLGMGKAQVQKVGDFVVIFEPLAGGGDHHHLAVGIGQDDIADLAVLARIGHGRAAEFCNDQDCFLFSCGLSPQTFRKRYSPESDDSGDKGTGVLF